MTTRFNKFERTNMFQNFDECVRWTADKTDAKDFDKYNNNIEYLKNTFNCVGYPDEDQVLHYINYIEETIENKDLDEFKRYIGIIFERSYETLSRCKEIIKEQNIIDKKNNQKQKNTTEKEIIKEHKLQEKEQQRIKKTEIREQNKLRKKEDAEKYATEILTCYCGMDYIRNKKQYHIASTKHETRMECIKWMQNPEVYKKYIFNNEEPDDSSISSLGSMDSNK